MGGLGLMVPNPGWLGLDLVGMGSDPVQQAKTRGIFVPSKTDKSWYPSLLD
jgi:hypothetical protein